MIIHPIFLIALSLPVAIALWIEWGKNHNQYVLCAFWMAVIFCALYVYIALVDPPVLQARATARLAFVFQWGLGAANALEYLYHLWRGAA